MGDLVFVTDNITMMKGVQRNLPIVINIDDKATALELEYNRASVINYMLMSLDSRIGEISNVATCYLNKQTKDEKQKDKYNDFVNLLSVINGVEIDYPKTGTRWAVPYYIAKYARPLPYFMKYAGSYYSKLKKLAKTRCNLNYLCWDIEKWQSEIRFKRKSPDTSDIMINSDIIWDEDKFNEVEILFNIFNKEMAEIQKQASMMKDYDKYKDFFEGLSRSDVINSKINWDIIYDKYKWDILNISSSHSELANYAVYLCYVKYPKKSKSFCWVITEEGLLNNIRYNSDGGDIFELYETGNPSDIEYMGRYYRTEG